MPKDAAGLETYPSYDKLVDYLTRNYAPEDATLQMLALVVATNMTQDLGFIVTPEEIMADAIKQTAKVKA